MVEIEGGGNDCQARSSYLTFCQSPFETGRSIAIAGRYASLYSSVWSTRAGLAENVHHTLLKTLSVTDESAKALLNTLYDRASIPYQQGIIQKQKQIQDKKLNKNQDQNPKKEKESDLASEKKNREREEIEARLGAEE